jgi:Flp pilus assembly protein TadG
MIMTRISKFLSRAGVLGHRLRADRSGMALIEFAYILPFMIPLTIVGLETANFAIVDMRVSQAAMMVADNAARVRDRIDEADINNIMLGAKLAGTGIDLMNKGRVVVATVEDNDATPANLTDQKVTWQRCKGVYAPSSTTTTEGAILNGGVGKTGNKISPTIGNPIIFVEVYYQVPLLVPGMSSPIFGTNPVIRYSSAFIIRDRSDQAIQNGSNLSGANKATCNYYNAT